MKILAFSDTHGDKDFSHLESRAENADIVICVGDILNMGMEREEVLQALYEFSKRVAKNIYLTHGNHESGLQDARYPESLIYLHQEVHETEHAVLVAYGGGGFAQTSPGFQHFIEQAHKKKFKKPVIWMMHGPPFGLQVDEVPWAGPTGCMTKREMIEKHQPHLVLCGHIHESAGVQTKHGSSLVVNAGAEGVLIEFNP